MSEPTKEELLDFMRKHGTEKVDSITDTESAIRHFRCTSKMYKEQCDHYKKERTLLMNVIDELKDKVEKIEQENEKLHKLIEIRENALKGADRIIKNKEHENEALRLQADVYFDEWQDAKKRIEELEKGEYK